MEVEAAEEKAEEETGSPEEAAVAGLKASVEANAKEKAAEVEVD